MIFNAIYHIWMQCPKTAPSPYPHLPSHESLQTQISRTHGNITKTTANCSVFCSDRFVDDHWMKIDSQCYSILKNVKRNQWREQTNDWREGRGGSGISLKQATRLHVGMQTTCTFGSDGGLFGRGERTAEIWAQTIH